MLRVLFLFCFVSLCSSETLFDENDEQRAGLIQESAIFEGEKIFSNAKKIVSGGYFTAALDREGRLMIQGMNANAEKAWGRPWLDIAAGTYSLYLLDWSRQIYAWDLRDHDSGPEATGIFDVNHICGGHEWFATVTTDDEALTFKGDLKSVPGTEKVEQICCGGDFLLVVDSNHQLYGQGRNNFGVFGKERELFKWKLLLDGQAVEHLSCGGDHVIAALRGGPVVAWGWAEKGQLGVGESNETKIEEPIVIEGMKTEDIKSIACSGYAHSGIVKKDGSVWTFGWNTYKQLAHSHDQDTVWNPQMMPNFSSSPAIDMASGSFKHSVVLLENGDVYGFGNNDYEQITKRTSDQDKAEKKVDKDEL